MRSTNLCLMGLIVVAITTSGNAAPPPNAPNPTIAAEDRIGDLMQSILQRLESIEKRLSTIERRLSRAKPIASEDVERCMQIDAIQFQRRMSKPSEELISPLQTP